MADNVTIDGLPPLDTPDVADVMEAQKSGGGASGKVTIQDVIDLVPEPPNGVLPAGTNGQTLRFGTTEWDATSALIVDDAGNVGIGTSSPTNKLTVAGTATIGETSLPDFAKLNVRNTDATLASLYLNNTSGGVDPWLQGLVLGLNNAQIAAISTLTSADGMQFYTGGSAATMAERMRIDTAGNVLFNATTLPTATTNSFGYQAGAKASLSRATTANVSMFDWINANGIVGSISTSGTATAYNTSSDYRLKENDVPMDNALERVNALRPIRFNFKADPGTTVDGFFAHEAQAVVPECVTGEKDAVKDQDILDDDGKVIGTEKVPDYQGIDQSKLVPLLVAAVQELTETVEELKSQLAKSKGAK